MECCNWNCQSCNFDYAVIGGGSCPGLKTEGDSCLCLVIEGSNCPDLVLAGSNCPDWKIGHDCHIADHKVAGCVAIAGADIVHEEIEGDCTIAHVGKTPGAWSCSTRFAETGSVASEIDMIGCAKPNASLPLSFPILRSCHHVF